MLCGLFRRFGVAQRLLGILVDGDRDGLDVLVAVAFPRR
jgi:hypothetical protein